MGDRLGLNAHAVAVSRLHERYGALIRAEIANTVDRVEDFEAELRDLMELISG